MHDRQRSTVYISLAALLIFIVSLYWSGAQFTGYQHAYMPLETLGDMAFATGIYFNVGAYIVPGSLLLLCALFMQQDMASAGQRIATHMLLLSALAFALFGLSPTNSVLEQPQWLETYRGMFWTLWWVAHLAGGLTVFVCSRRLPGWWRGVGIVLTCLVPALALFGYLTMPLQIAQRLSMLAWFTGWVWLTWGFSTHANSPRVEQN